MKRGLYLVTPDWLDTERLLAVSEAALKGGATILQYRHKTADTALRLMQAKALRRLTRYYEAALIVNDDLDLALAVSADGLHIGREDGELSALRAKAKRPLQIGVSCYNDFSRARAAAAEGAAYVAFGAMYASPTKPEAVAAPITLIRQAKTELDVPVACIGGITATNARPLVQAGADWVAVITDIYQAKAPEQQARLFAALYA
jgi:thiamine-phosphate pyrophosphorylase